VPVRQDLDPSPALSIVKNGPPSFEGRKVGVLVTDGSDGEVLSALEAALAKEGAMMAIVAPQIGGVTTSDGRSLMAQFTIEGGPSALYDAVAVLPGEEGARQLAGLAVARDFVADAFAHLKVIGHSAAAAPLLKEAGVKSADDPGILPLAEPGGVEDFLAACRKLRVWQRERQVRPS
jgi:catalase